MHHDQGIYTCGLGYRGLKYNPYRRVDLIQKQKYVYRNSFVEDKLSNYELLKF